MLELLNGRSRSRYGECVFLNVKNNINTPKLQASDVVLNEDQAVDWVVPAGVNYISAVAVGAGGSGEGSNGTVAGSGGGAGALSYINEFPVNSGDILKVFVGRKGLNSNDGQSGGQGEGASGIKLNGETILHAGSGGGGWTRSVAGEGGIALAGDFVRNGGKGAGGGTNAGGDGGSVSDYYSAGADASANSSYSGFQNTSGGFGASPYGPSGYGSFETTIPTKASNGGLGGKYGGGGGGANDESSGGTDYDGGNGGEGFVRIIYGPGRRFPSELTDESYSQGNIYVSTISV